MSHIMEVYKPIQWHCPKCGQHPHHTSYRGDNDTLIVTCAGCRYWETCLPKDRKQSAVNAYDLRAGVKLIKDNDI